MTIAFALACHFMPACSEESTRLERAMPLADDAPRMQQDHRFRVVPVAAPQARSSDKSSVTLWDELVPPVRLPIPIPVALPRNVQHAMEGHAGNRMQQ
ncbi:hypothetical protein [Burkholderia sp. SCN-KJ]|uniref:hypothetical protein n=1 Tax=Burkholderia sp. SCN-KJ TaxID=2969248 RepID=UPI0021501877|nr:hypothetical protein [Burkholderia sp. SCN-KJ]MCR4464774.1 hypothetical protein [Burkholderia sp. SCN-KJ]